MKPKATLSLDLDNQWSYMKIHGDAGWQQYPTYLNVVVPRVIELLKELNLTITVFVVGKDAERAGNKDALQQIRSVGHEIGNHSHFHESWMHQNSIQDIEREFDLVEDAIEKVTGVRTVGFRGPGFCLSEDMLRVLQRRAYLYDASTLPTFVGPLARAYYFMNSNLRADEREKRKLLFGSVREGTRPLKPYTWAIDGHRLLEIPVTTYPLVRMPFHLSYVIYLASISPRAAKVYWRSALAACRVSGVEPSILLHPLDFISGDEVPSVAFFPGMNVPKGRKAEIVRECLVRLADEFEILPLGSFARSLQPALNMPSIAPSFMKGAGQHMEGVR